MVAQKNRFLENSEHENVCILHYVADDPRMAVIMKIINWPLKFVNKPLTHVGVTAVEDFRVYLKTPWVICAIIDLHYV
jgi:hypothetical protein